MTRSLALGLAAMIAISSVAYAVPKSDMTKADVSVNETLSAKDITLILEIARLGIKNLGRTAADFPGVDLDKNTVRITNDDQRTRALYIEQKLLGDQDDYPRMRMFCEAKPKIAIDAGVFKGMTDVGTLASFHGQVIEGLWNACGNPESAPNKAFVKKIKTIHFVLAAATCTVQPYAADRAASNTYDFNPKTGEMTVGVCFFGGANIKQSVINWIAKQ